MTTGDLCWLARLLSAFYPSIKQRALELARQRLLSRPQAPACAALSFCRQPM
jgi:hypothetical protein